MGVAPDGSRDGNPPADSGTDAAARIPHAPSGALIVPIRNAGGLALHGNYAYVTTIMGRDIFRVDMASGSTAVLLSVGPDERLDGPIASTTDTLYFGVSEGEPPTAGYIMRAPIEGGGATKWQPSGINTAGVVATGDYVFWSSLNSPPGDASVGSVVARRALDGGAVVIMADQQQFVTALSVDAQYVYWTSVNTAMHTGVVRRAPLLGAAAIDLVDGGFFGGVFAGGSQLYLSNRGTNGGVDCVPSDGAVERRDVDGGAAMTIATGQYGPGDLAADDKYVYWLNEGAYCNIDRSGAGTLYRGTVGGMDPEPLVTGILVPRALRSDTTRIAMTYSSSEDGEGGIVVLMK